MACPQSSVATFPRTGQGPRSSLNRPWGFEVLPRMSGHMFQYLQTKPKFYPTPTAISQKG
eukprot:1501940-Pyramimonas_sp.AAC.1